MRLLSLPRISWRIAAIAVISLSILHILATLAAPSLTTTTAYARLKQLQANTMHVLPPLAPDTQPLPFLGADARYALCRFEAARTPVALKVSLPGKGWTLALYSNEGDNFYVAAGADGRRTDLSLLLVTSDERFTGVSPEARGQTGERQTTLPITTSQGIAVLRAPDRGIAYRSRDEAELKRAVCAPQQ